MKKYKLFLLLCLIVLVSGCSYSIKINTNSSNDKDDSESTSSISLVVPDVSGIKEEDAKSILKLNGFEVGEVLYIVDNNYEDGLVVKTDPVIGREVKEDTLINLYISTSNSYEVENYVGKNYLAVKAELEDFGLIVEVIEKSYLVEQQELMVVEQDPKVGTVLTKGDKVILYIQKDEALYPDFVGEKWNINEVEDFCSKYGITLVKKYEVSEKAEGMIIRQSRMAGTEIVNGTTLTITISGSGV